MIFVLCGPRLAGGTGVRANIGRMSVDVEDSVATNVTISRPGAAGQRGSLAPTGRWDRYFKWVILVPAVITLLVAAVLPLIWMLVTSFYTDNILTGVHEFRGLGNYIQLLTDPQIWHFIANTVIYVVFSVGVGFPIALGIAKLLSLRIRFRVLWIVAIILPWVFPKIAGAIMWTWMLDQQYGVLNYLLNRIGLINDFIAFLAHTGTAFATIIWVDLWYWTPFAILILFGGFSRIPNELAEAARMDGANAWQVFRHIELPYIMPEILAVLLLRTMFSFREFGIPFLLGNGSPGRTTEILGLTIYKFTVSRLQLGLGAALSVVLLLIMIVILAFYFRVIRVDKGIQAEPIYE